MPSLAVNPKWVLYQSTIVGPFPWRFGWSSWLLVKNARSKLESGLQSFRPVWKTGTLFQESLQTSSNSNRAPHDPKFHYKLLSTNKIWEPKPKKFEPLKFSPTFLPISDGFLWVQIEKIESLYWVPWNLAWWKTCGHMSSLFFWKYLHLLLLKTFKETRFEAIWTQLQK